MGTDQRGVADHPWVDGPEYFEAPLGFGSRLPGESELVTQAG
jgi:hypothetical protein